MPDETSNIVYTKPVLDFVTVCVEFCATLEKDEPYTRKEWLQKMTRLLPMLYIKASLLPDLVDIGDGMTETFVREEDYSRVMSKVAAIMGAEDMYLDVFVEDMKYSDVPVSASVSENIADIYQDVRDFVSVYQFEITAQMYDALVTVAEDFKSYWGQKLVNVLRPMHALLHDETTIDDYADNSTDDEGGFWE